MTTMTEVIAAQVEIGKIIIQGQVRKLFDDGRLKELAASIKKVGVLQPIILRKATSGGKTKEPYYYLVAGERRLRAAKLAGLPEIPARIMELDDQAAAEVQAIENIQRKDLTPIEEAQAFKQLMDGAKWSAEDLAARVNKEKNYVYRAIRLLELPDDVVEAIHMGKLTPAHGHQFLRLDDKKQQEALAKSCVKDHNTAKELREWIDQKVGQDLAKAPFPKDVDYAGKIACSGCPLNSGNQGDLFGEVKKGRCTGPRCFQVKMNQVAKDMEAEIKEKHPGIQFVGFFKADWGPGGFKNDAQIRGCEATDDLRYYPERLAKAKSLLRESPEKFKALIHQEHGDLKIRFFFPTQALREAKAPAPSTPAATAEREKARKERQATMRQNFIERYVEEQLLRAGLESAEKKFGRLHLAVIIGSMGYLNKAASELMERAGLQTESMDPEDLAKKLRADELMKLAFGFAIAHQGSVDTRGLELVGVDVKAKEKAARVAATAAWESRKTAKAAGKAAAAGKK